MELCRLGVVTTPQLPDEGHYPRGIMAPIRTVQSDSLGFDDKTEPLPSDCQCHILFGDHWNERYRMSTFSLFPQDSPVKIWNMARAGFYYLGYRDRVRCCSCGKIVENWLVSDNVLSSKWHASDCNMLLQRHSQDSGFYEVIGELIKRSKRMQTQRLIEEMSIHAKRSIVTHHQENVVLQGQRNDARFALQIGNAPSDEDENVARDPPRRRLNLRRLNTSPGTSEDRVKKRRRSSTS